MSDLTGLHGVIATSLRWSSANGVLGRTVIDPETGERTIEPIELGSSEARLAMDFSCRDRGYTLIRPGMYDARLSPVGSPFPEWPGEDFKPGFGLWLASPSLGQLRWETAQATVLGVMDGVWEHVKSFKESSVGGLEPVIHFASRREVQFPSLGKMFFAPVIHLIGFVERSKIPSFAQREPTVKAVLANDRQIPFAAMENRTPLQQKVAAQLEAKPAGRTTRKKEPPPKPITTGDFIDDEIPPFDT
jgi:hypothetical protein